MDLISTLLGVSFASGLNVYATVLAMGLLNRWGFVHLPPSLDVISTTPILVVAAILYAVEFFVDKVPFLDSMWDALHTVIRPAAGALLAFGAVGHVDPKWQILAALLGGSLALTSHAAKASTRVAVQVSPEPISNWILSVTEDGIAVLLVWLVGAHPLIGLAAAVTITVAAVFVIWKFYRLAQRA